MDLKILRYKGTPDTMIQHIIRSGSLYPSRYLIKSDSSSRNHIIIFFSKETQIFPYISKTYSEMIDFIQDSKFLG